MKKTIIWSFLFISLSLAVLPIFKPYVAGMADGLGHRFRLVSFYNSLKEGNIRPRWANDAALGYGAPIFFYNYPLPYYIGSLFLFLGFSVNGAGQILAALALFFSGFFMFLLGRKLFGDLGGLVATVVYTFAPYHLQMTYLYDAWGEMLAFVFPPLILYLTQIQNSKFKIQNYNSKVKSNKKIFNFNLNFYILHFAFLILSWFLFILSHNVSVLMFTPILILLGFISVRPRLAIPQGEAFIKIIMSFSLAVILSAFFWLPAVVMQNEMKYPLFLITEGGMRGSFFKSFSFQWETALRLIKGGSAHYLDFTVGLPILLIIFVSLLHIINSKLKAQSSKLQLKTQNFLRFIAFRFRFDICDLTFAILAVLIISLYFTNYLSSWIWNVPPFTYILYPFRFLFVASFAGGLLGGLVAGKNWFWAVAIIILAIIQGRPYLNPYVDVLPFPDSYFYQTQTVTAAPLTQKNMLVREFLPKGVNDDFLIKLERGNREREEAFFKNEKGQVRVDYKGNERLILNIDTVNEDDLIINRFYFPNWEVKVDGGLKKVNIDADGRMMVAVPAGRHKVELKFGTTAVEKIANVIFLCGLAVLLFIRLRRIPHA